MQIVFGIVIGLLVGIPAGMVYEDYYNVIKWKNKTDDKKED